MADEKKYCMTHYPAEVLSSPAEPIAEITDEIRQLAARMIEIMIEQKGVGLAGPQAGVNLRIFVISLDGTPESAKVYINPKINTSGGIEANSEGCLSLPNITANIKRFKLCTVTAMDLDGNEFTEDADGLYSRALQHEFDHLEGMMIKDRMGRVSAISAKRHLKKLEEESDSLRE
jgi:peptide deformylase